MWVYCTDVGGAATVVVDAVAAWVDDDVVGSLLEEEAVWDAGVEGG